MPNEEEATNARSANRRATIGSSASRRFQGVASRSSARRRRAARPSRSAPPKSANAQARRTRPRDEPLSPRRAHRSRAASTARRRVADLIDGTFLAYNAARLREACQLFAEKMLEPDVTVGLTLTGALTPAGLGMAALIPLIEAGFVDWIISTGANLYHDTHFGLGLAMHRGNAQESDVVLREEGVVRIYDIFFDYDVLLSTDAFFRADHPGAGVPAPDVERGVPLPVRQVRARARDDARHRQEVAARRRVRSAACRSTRRRRAIRRSA